MFYITHSFIVILHEETEEFISDTAAAFLLVLRGVSSSANAFTSSGFYQSEYLLFLVRKPQDLAHGVKHLKFYLKTRVRVCVIHQELVDYASINHKLKGRLYNIVNFAINQLPGYRHSSALRTHSIFWLEGHQRQGVPLHSLCWFNLSGFRVFFSL